MSTKEHIKKDLYQYGPNAASMLVYDDFLTYKSGVYVRKSKHFLGGHVIKSLGWGIEPKSGIHYWIMANSWSQNWG